MRIRLTLAGTVALAALPLATGTAVPAPAPAAPSVANLIAPSAVTMKQGHLRFLVGIRTATTARVIVRVISVKTGKVVRTQKTAGRHKAGRVWLLVEGTSSAGSQLPAGRYRIEVYAVDAQKRRSNTITGAVKLAFRTPRGVVQAYTVQAWPSIIAGVVAAPGGQIVAALGVRADGTRTAIERAGLLRGDVIHTLNGVNVDQHGSWLAALRALPAGSPVPLELDRAGVRQTIQYTAPADWAAPVDYRAPLSAAVAAAPGVLAYMYASVRERLDAKDTPGARALFDPWTAAQKDAAPGELAEGSITAAEGAAVQVPAGNFNRAIAADATMAAAQFAMGLVRTSAVATDPAPPKQRDFAIKAFEAATGLDPTDALAPTFWAFSLLSADRFADALAAADQAILRDPRYEEARIARGVALIGLGRVPEGVADLKRGLLLMDDPARAQRFITDFLEPNTK